MGKVQFRPRLIVFDHCKHVRMTDVTVQNSPSWQIVPYYTDDMMIRNIRVLAPQHSPNTDAIDPFSSSNMVIDHVYADVGDDNIAIKSGMINSPGPDSPSKNITITDCEFMHGHGLSIGSELAGGAQNIHAERIHFKGTDQGIRIKANRDRGNDVSNLSFKDITMEDVKTSILISEYYPKVLPQGDVAAEPVQRLTPFFHDITIENVKSVNSPLGGRDRWPAGIAGQGHRAQERRYSGDEGHDDCLRKRHRHRCEDDGDGRKGHHGRSEREPRQSSRAFITRGST